MRIIFTLGLLIFLFGTGNQSFAQSELLNYGFKVGMNALSPTQYQTYYAGDSTAGSYINKNGYLAGAFFRINYNRVFLQPEVIWNFHRQQCGFMLPDTNAENIYLPKTLNINMDAVNTNLLAGYSMIKNKPYLCDIYLGASLKWTYKIKYEITEEHDYSAKSNFSCYAGVIGFSVSISKLYFDFRYEINQPNTNLDFSKILGISDPYQSVFLEKNENILSFSCGIIF
ncbi:MAG: PorT family protein [Dysgonamonadaceae bacterium]|nr:PorT family protein [Dysgonamonadaceae bacterium]